jgi:hypothetical protein
MEAVLFVVNFTDCIGQVAVIAAIMLDGMRSAGCCTTLIVIVSRMQEGVCANRASRA